MTTSKRTAAGELEIGMYVSRLDRPWLETPFLFQGFYIRNEHDIKSIRQHCDYVFIDTSKCDSEVELNGRSVADHTVIPGRKTEGLRDPDSLVSRIYRGITELGKKKKIDPQVTGLFYRDSTRLKDELVPATDIHKTCYSDVSDVMQELRESKKLDIKRLKSSVEPMVESVLRNQAAMACLMRLKRKDEYLYSHSLGSSVWATILGRHIGLDKEALNLVALGAMLLDVGKTKLPYELLVKPDNLTESEQKLMQKHIQYGVDIIEESGDVDRRVVDMVQHHHQRHNGTGYPQHLEGNEIPVYGRIAGIVDTYDAMITERAYAKQVSSFDALRTLKVLADVEFQAEMVEQFIQAIGVFPTGSLVELNTGEVGIVISQNHIRRLRPEVMLILDREKNHCDNFRIVNLNDVTAIEGNKQSLWIEKDLQPGAYGLDPADYYTNQ